MTNDNTSGLTSTILSLEGVVTRQLSRAWEACRISGSTMARERISAPLFTLELAKRELAAGNEAWARKLVERAEATIYGWS